MSAPDATYRGYPVNVAMPYPPGSLIARGWSENQDITLESVMPPIRKIWCGPPAPLPAVPTPEEILYGALAIYLADGF